MSKVPSYDAFRAPMGLPGFRSTSKMFASAKGTIIINTPAGNQPASTESQIRQAVGLSADLCELLLLVSKIMQQWFPCFTYLFIFQTYPNITA